VALSTVMSDPQNQHWLPQFYLRGFAVPGFRKRKNAKIWVWPKDDNEPLKSKVREICAKEFLYSHVRPDGSRCFRTEKKLAALETTISRLYPRIAEGFPNLEQAWGIKKLLSLFFGTLLLRHPDEFQGTKHTHRELVAWYETLPRDSLGRPIIPDYELEGTRYPFDASQWEEYRDANENAMTKMFAETIEANAVSLANEIYKKRWAFLCLDQPRLFTSDFPLVVKHPDRKIAGLGTPGVHLFFPVSPTRMLHMSDRENNSDGFYPFPRDRAAELNFFTLGNSKQFILSHEQPAPMLEELDIFNTRLISREYERCSTAIGSPRPQFSRTVPAISPTRP
jgi:Protein of unknown function (DUF4238)